MTLRGEGLVPGLPRRGCQPAQVSASHPELPLPGPPRAGPEPLLLNDRNRTRQTQTSHSASRASLAASAEHRQGQRCVLPANDSRAGAWPSARGRPALGFGRAPSAGVSYSSPTLIHFSSPPGAHFQRISAQPGWQDTQHGVRILAG